MIAFEARFPMAYSRGMMCPKCPIGRHQDTFVFKQLRYAARCMMVELYAGILLSLHPVSKLTPKKHARNPEIRARHRAGESLSSLVEAFGITEQ